MSGHTATVAPAQMKLPSLLFTWIYIFRKLSRCCCVGVVLLFGVASDVAGVAVVLFLFGVASDVAGIKWLLCCSYFVLLLMLLV